jgi:hypothetical protein
MKRPLIPILLFLVAVPAAAQMRTMLGPFGGVFDLPVAADGTVLVERNVPGGGIELAAITPAGVVKWTYALDRGIASMKLSDSAVLVTFIEFASAPTAVLTPRSRVTQLSLADGRELAEITVDGMIGSITPHKEGFYVLALTPDGPAPGFRPGAFLQKRKLISLDNFGNRKFELAID